MQVELMLAFGVTCVLIELTPGPNMAYLAILTSHKGKPAGYSAVVGIGLGLSIIGVAAGLGLTSLIQESVLAYQVLRWGGIVYLFWLAWDAWRDTTSRENTPESLRWWVYLSRGMLTNLLNPKAALFYVAMLPRYVSDEYHALPQMLSLVAIYVSIATLIHLVIVNLANQANHFLNSENQRRTFSRILAILLVFVAVWFAWVT